jgi:putative proteasome-type protease
VYPEGNWVDATDDAPSFTIGRTAYGKPILDRLLHYDTPLPQAVALAYLAFDSTRASVVDVEFPIDLVLLVATDGVLRQHRFTAEDLTIAQGFWRQQLQDALEAFPLTWATPILRPTERTT